MGPSDLLRLAAFLARVARFPGGLGPDPGVGERRDQRTAGGTRCDEYAPRDGKPRCTAVLVHGMTPNGKAEPRLEHFARAAARAGVRCLVPHLPGLADCRWDPADLDVLADAVRQSAAAGPGSPGLVGFSYGATHALRVAARPDVAPLPRFVLAFGPCRSVRELHEHYRASWETPAASDAERDDRIYARLVLAWRHREALALCAEAREAIEDLLRRFCHAAALAEKQAIHERHVRDLALPPAKEDDATREAFEASSPAGRLSGLRCPVSLVHDRHDFVVPCSHSEALFEELRGLQGGERHRLVLTTLLQRREPAAVPPVGEMLRLFGALAPLLAGD
ncbi:MAG: alpha/beta hydrolase [Deltaproteobacteria bacterium]|nr:alpha/beta hydrolase [Deltaproteobacteria bacterium]